MDWLVNTLEAEIIPRLMAAYSLDPDRSNAGGPRAVQPEEVLTFTDIALHREPSDCRQFVDSIQRRGIPLHAIYLDLITPAARTLGHLWTDDRCDFTQVTVALWRMQQIMYDLSPMFQLGQGSFQAKSHSIMLMPVPGSQHTLGILMVAEFFRRSGWKVWGDPTADRERLLDAVHDEPFDLAGISIGSEVHIPALNDFIEDLRRHSRNHALQVMVGGPLLHHQPELKDAIRADIFSTDAQHAVSVAERIVAMTSSASVAAR
jgi:methanogenic corrinoid protein MtbC1